MKSLFGVLSLFLISATASAETSKVDRLASEVAEMVVTQSYCGLSYNADEVNRHINDVAQVNAVEFNFSFNLFKGVLETAIEKYEEQKARGEDVTGFEAELTERCTELRQKAEAYGFLN